MRTTSINSYFDFLKRLFNYFLKISHIHVHLILKRPINSKELSGKRSPSTHAVSLKERWGSSDKELIPGLEQETHQTSLAYLLVLESEEAVKCRLMSKSLGNQPNRFTLVKGQTI